MITLAEYWMGRDVQYADQLTPEIEANATKLLEAVNGLLEHAAADGVRPGIDSLTRTPVASGWRPPAVNARTSNAGHTSAHLTGQAVDLQDTSQRALARWCLSHLFLLEAYGLYMEDPQWTGGRDPWVHLGTRPPRSGKRVYVPASTPPIAAKLPEQLAA